MPIHLKLPLTIIASLDDKASAYYIEWVVNNTVECFFYVDILDITLHINLLAFGSIPVDGSSKKIMLGFPIIAIATDNFLLFPPDKEPDSLCSCLINPNYLIIWFIAASLNLLGKHFIS